MRFCSEGTTIDFEGYGTYVLKLSTMRSCSEGTNIHFEQVQYVLKLSTMRSCS